jgi:N-methylhydantoinase A
MWRIGTDTGGTFTDLVAVDETGRMRLTKTPSTPGSFEKGVMTALTEIGIEPADLEFFYHATTVATNAILTRAGASAAIVTTAGFRDVLELRDGSRQELYDVTWNPPAPLVERHRRLEVRERLNYRGEVVVPLDDGDVREVAQALKVSGVDAVAVCLLHSYVNPVHERRVEEILREELPRAYVCTSSEVLPEPPEFVRTATTAANAYVGPVIEVYLGKLANAISSFGYSGPVAIMHSGGGTMTFETAVRVPIRTSTSGPAAGVLACAEIARDAGRENAVSLDMGGTSADIATIHRGKPRLTPEHPVEWGLPVRFPTIDVAVIGAGGGSIAWIDAAGVPHSGPQSAGADPGPACYGRGGSEPTNTDANVVLGRVRPESLLGGRLRLYPELAHEVIEKGFASPLGRSVIGAASSIIRLSNEHMANGIRRVTIQRGLDPREFSLVAFGGAGPMHAVELARSLQIPEVIVPPMPGATSAMGLLFADVRHDLVSSCIAHQDYVDEVRMAGVVAGMGAQAVELLTSQGFERDAMQIERLIDVRYQGQVRVITLPWHSETFTRADWDAAIEEFHASYEAEFGYAVRDLPVELIAVRVAATGVTPKPAVWEDSVTARADEARVGSHIGYFGGSEEPIDVALYDRARLHAGATLSGPALIEQFDSTTVVPPDARVEVDRFRNLVITV